MWKNVVQPDRPQMRILIIRRMLIACWTPKATDKHSQYVILPAFPLQQWLRERAPMLCYMHIVCHVTICVFHKQVVATKSPRLTLWRRNFLLNFSTPFI